MSLAHAGSGKKEAKYLDQKPVQTTSGSLEIASTEISHYIGWLGLVLPNILPEQIARRLKTPLP
jgi:hypothetical protein